MKIKIPKATKPRKPPAMPTKRGGLAKPRASFRRVKSGLSSSYGKPKGY
jgi:hypothetical protein